MNARLKKVKQAAEQAAGDFRIAKKLYLAGWSEGWRDNRRGCDIGRGSQLWYSMHEMKCQGYEDGQSARTHADINLPESMARRAAKREAI